MHSNMKLAKFSLISPIVAICVALCAALSSFGAPQYRVEMTTSGYAGTESLANFPVLVKFAKDAPVGFDYSQFQPGQTDLSFEDASGNKLAYEIDTWDEEGTSFVWVKVPELTAETKIVAKWGDPEATSVPTERANGAVWGAAGYAAVWHFSEENGTAYDSTGNGLDAAPEGKNTEEMTASADAAVGRSRVITTASNVNYLTVPNNEKLNLGAAFTASGWFKASSMGTNGRIFERKNGSWNGAKGWETQWKGFDQVQARGADGYNSTATIPARINNGYQQIVFVFNDVEVETGKCNVHVYCNGAYVCEQGPTALATDSTFALKMMGSAYYRGTIDEFRLQDAVASADWIKAEYDTVKSAAFYETGAVVDAEKIDAFLVGATIDPSVGTLTPQAGRMAGLADGQEVKFSAPEEEFAQADGSYLTYVGYRLFTIVDGVETLVEESTELAGGYTHVAGQGARLEWKQSIRRGAVTFKTDYVSIVSVPGYTGAETLRNVQVLFRLRAGAPEDFDYSLCRADGADICFTDANGHGVPHEVEKWDPEGESLFWVNLPTLKAGTTFRFCFGNADVTEPLNTPSDVWVDAGYAGVWHMNEAEASDNAVDATANGNNGVPTGASTEQMSGTDGVIAGARTIGTSSVKNYFAVGNADSLDLGPSFTVSLWLKGSGSTNTRLFERKSGWSDANGWEIQWNSATTATPRGSTGSNDGVSTIVPNATTWSSACWVYAGDAITTYVNGEKVRDNASAAVVDNDLPLLIGATAGDGFKGCYDEVRLCAGSASAAHVKADYDTVTKADFLFAAKISAAADSDTFTVESADVERGAVTPTWGRIENLTDGQVVAFSAPTGGQMTDDPKTNFCFTGYELYVTAGGVERLAEKKDAVVGSYTHAEGQSARLVWFTRDMPLVAVDVGEGGTVEGPGHYLLGETVTLTAVPAEGMRFKGWSGDLPNGVKASGLTVSFVADRAYQLTATFAEKSVCAAFFSWKGHAEGETVTTDAAANDLGTVTFAASSVNARGTGGVLPVFSKRHPARTIYTDAGRNEVLATDPGSIYITSENATTLKNGGGDVVFDTFGTWISQQRSCTVEFFVRTEVYQQYAGAWSMLLSGQTQVFYAADGGEPDLSFAVEAGTSKGRATPANKDSFINEAWQHVAVVYDRENQKVTCYRNYGAGAEKDLVITETSESAPLYLGSSYGRAKNTSNCFNGWISCLRVTKGALMPDEFMRAGVGEGAGDTVVLFDFRGRAGTAVDMVKPKLGDADAYTGRPYNKSLAPTYVDDIPGEAIFDGEAGVAAKVPLSKRVGAISFTAQTSGYLVFDSLSTAVSDLEEYTIEFFAKCEETAAWKAAISWNDIGKLGTQKPNEVQIPGNAATTVTVQSEGQGSFSFTPKAGTNVADGQWHHVAVTYVQATDSYTLYYDGVKGGSLSANGKHAFTASPFVLGTEIGNRDKELYNGKISCLRVSSRALSPSEFLVAGPKPLSGLTILVR